MKEFALQPNLTGRLIRLRPLLQDDFEELFSVASDPQIWDQHPQKDRYQRPVFAAFFAKAIDSKGALLVLDSKTDKVIGSSRFYDLSANKVTIGFTFLARSHWGAQANGELKSLMLQHAFQFVDTVVFEIGEQNVRSRKAIEKIGAKLTGRIEQKWPDGSLKTSVIYQIKKDDDSINTFD